MNNFLSGFNRAAFISKSTYLKASSKVKLNTDGFLFNNGGFFWLKGRRNKPKGGRIPPFNKLCTTKPHAMKKEPVWSLK
ncbi:Putative protein [Zobellia galactanivorans]|uniref:Uncharacterized protein n=1 Tax=Zobellia galactanivorans (strain DSM 12802 / CCUG 47099 / CIP 106680 / NCIMB 13871 / Dsij) TaxID=63186 RepID=G0L4Y3_ZOBGA|nr:Putative protein [Zobellia galactanivorans]